MADSPPQSKSKKSVFTEANVRRVLPFVSMGLELLSAYAPARPYVRTARTVSAAAAAAFSGTPLSREADGIAYKLKEIRQQIVAAEAANDMLALEKLRIRQDIYLDILLERITEE